MAKITFAYNKQKIAEFHAESLEFARQDGGLLVTASGEMAFQDTALVESLLNHKPNCHITIEKDGEAVLSQNMDITFFTFEHTELAVLLQ